MIQLKPFNHFAWIAMMSALLALAFADGPKASAQVHKQHYDKHHGKIGFSSGLKYKLHKNFKHKSHINHRSRSYQPKHHKSYTSGHKYFNSRFFHQSHYRSSGLHKRSSDLHKRPLIVYGSSRKFNSNQHASYKSVDTHSTRTQPSTRLDPIYDAQQATVTTSDAWALLQAGQDARAQLAFGQLASADPENPRHKVGFGLASALLEQNNLAETAFHRAIAIDTKILDRFASQAIAQAVAHDLIASQNPAHSSLHSHQNLRTYLQHLAASHNPSHDYPNDSKSP